MRFSRKTDYGIILLQSLQRTFPNGTYISLSRVAKEQGLSLSFLEKLGERLRREGYLESHRGPEGGYRMLKDPRSVTLKELIQVFEEPEMMRCMKSQRSDKTCPLVAICPTRASWLEIEKRVNTIFESVTLDAL